MLEYGYEDNAEHLTAIWPIWTLHIPSCCSGPVSLYWGHYTHTRHNTITDPELMASVSPPGGEQTPNWWWATDTEQVFQQAEQNSLGAEGSQAPDW